MLCANVSEHSVCSILIGGVSKKNNWAEIVSLLGHSPSKSPSFRSAKVIFEPNFFPYKYPNNLILVILPAYTTYEDGTDTML